jgi:hypothetical protein
VLCSGVSRANHHRGGSLGRLRRYCPPCDAIACTPQSLIVVPQSPYPRPFRAVAPRFTASPLARWTKRCARQGSSCEVCFPNGLITRSRWMLCKAQENSAIADAAGRAGVPSSDATSCQQQDRGRKCSYPCRKIGARPDSRRIRCDTQETSGEHRCSW